MPEAIERDEIKMSDEDVIALVTKPFDAACEWEEEMSEKREDCDDLYHRKEYGNEAEDFSHYVAPVVFDTIEWLMPSMVDIFTHPDFFTVNMEDGEKAEKNKKLLRYQIFSQQRGSKEIRNYVQNALRYFNGVFKTVYVEDYDEEKVERDYVSSSEMESLIQDEYVDIISYEEVEDTSDGTSIVSFQDVKYIQRTVNYRGPSVNCIPPEDIRYTPDGATIDECTLVAHRQTLTLDEIMRGELSGQYKKGSSAKVSEHGEPFEFYDNSSGGYTDFDYQLDRDIQNPNDYIDDNTKADVNKRFFVDEIYMSIDIDGDGLSEPVIIHRSGDVVLSMEKNPYGRPPFRFGCTIEQPNKIEGLALPLILEKDQREMTMLRRTYVDSVAESSFGTMVTNNAEFGRAWAGRGVDDVLLVSAGTTYDSVRPDQPSDSLMKAMDMIQTGYERTSGVNSLNQGLTADNMGKTATGTVALQNAGQQRQKLFATLLGEPLQDVIKDCIEINKMYPPTDDVIILGREAVTISPDDLDGDADVSIEVGVSPNDRVVKAQALEGHYVKLAQSLIPAGAAGPEHLLRTEKKIAKLNDINVDNLQYSDEEFSQVKVMQDQMQQMQAQIQQLQQQAMQAPPQQGQENNVQP